MGLTQRGRSTVGREGIGVPPGPQRTPFHPVSSPFTPHYGRESKRQARSPQFLVQPLPSWYPAKFSTRTVMDLSLFPAEEKSTREDPAPHWGSRAGTGTPNHKPFAELRTGEVIKGGQGCVCKFPHAHREGLVGKGMHWQGMPGHGGGLCTGRLHPSGLNPSQIPAALLEPQLLTDACGDFEQS